MSFYPGKADQGIASMEQTAHRLGRAFGDFLTHLARRARDRGARRVFFLSREGHWLAETYTTMRDRTRDGERFPAAIHLPVSRRSTFLPSLDGFAPDQLAPILAQHNTATVLAVLLSLGWFDEDVPAAHAALDECELEQAWNVAGPALLERPAIRNALEERRRVQRERLERLLAMYEFAADAGPIVVADIGWRGSIQDNLGRLLPGLPLHGVYFLLQPAFVPSPPGITKESFLKPRPRHPFSDLRRLRFAAPLELVISSECGTVVGYADEGERVVPVLDNRPLSTREAGKVLERFRAAMAEVAAETGFERPSCPHSALVEVLDFLEDPPDFLAACYFETLRDERFGTGKLLGAQPPVTPGMLVKALLNRQARLRFARMLAESGWPSAVIKRDLPLLVPLWRCILTTLDPRLPGGMSKGGSAPPVSNQAGGG